MVWQLQKVSNYGTSTPAVARTLLQGSEILGFFVVPETQREQAKEVLHELQRHLVRCVQVRDQIANQVDLAHDEIKRSGFHFQSDGRAVTLPGVGDLQSKSESFLQSAKLGICETARLVEPFYGVKHDHKYNRFAAWAEEKFGKDDTFTKAVRDWEPWVKRVVDMRNAVDHPKERPGGRLFTQNFRLSGSPGAPALVDPSWNLLGESEVPIVGSMDSIIEGIIELGEEILAGLFYKFKQNFPIVLHEIPLKERDPSCPTRLRVGLAAHPPSAKE